MALLAISLQCSIAKRNLEITHREAIAQAARKKTLRKELLRKGKVIIGRDVHCKGHKKSGN